ncbi:MAG: HAD family hydrolase [Clostridiaceae bacterium]|nr:HAD family hydrolase [Clostridiaceae bacterium]
MILMKYILFDLDGTLTDPKEGITKSVQYALKKFGIEEECDNLTKFIGPPLDISFKEFYGFDSEESKLALKYYRERYSEIGLFENKIISGIPEVLDQLKKSGKILLVATSKPTIFSIKICDKFNLSQYFHKILGSELNGERSNKWEVINELIKEYNCSLDDAIMIGDRKHDIIGAKKCGISSIGVQFGYAEKGELAEAGADYIVNRPEELLNIIL